MSLNVTVRLDVPDGTLENGLCSAFEGGSNYWIKQVEIVTRGPPEGDDKDAFLCCHAMRGEVRIIPNGYPEGKLINAESIRAGVAALAADVRYRHHLVDLIQENDDAITGDVLLQFITFGDVIFG